MVSRAVTVSLLTRLAVPKHRVELLGIYIQEEAQCIKDLEVENGHFLMEREVDMDREFNQQLELPGTSLDMDREFKQQLELPGTSVDQEFSSRLELLHGTTDPEDLDITAVEDSTPDSMAMLLDIAQVVLLHIPTLLIPTTTLKIKI